LTVGRVFLPSLGEEVSALGFGCASLGSRIAPEAGTAALERALDMGVTWFDVAPSYGDGQAEALLGRFARGRRDRVHILTKVGIAPPVPSLRQRLARPVLRTALAAAPGLRAAIRRRRPVATKAPLTAAMIASSIEASLVRLGTDHVDVLALHDATPEETAREDILDALRQARSSGKARCVAIASSPAAAAAGMEAAPDLYGIVQLASNPFEPGLVRLAAMTDRAADRVTHSVYGADGGVARLSRLIDQRPALRVELADAGYDGGSASVAAAFLADYAFDANADGVVLVSMFGQDHLVANISRFSRTRDRSRIRAIARHIGSEAAS
jgi:hypothetical protein